MHRSPEPGPHPKRQPAAISTADSRSQVRQITIYCCTGRSSRTYPPLMLCCTMFYNVVQDLQSTDPIQEACPTTVQYKRANGLRVSENQPHSGPHYRGRSDICINILARTGKRRLPFLFERSEFLIATSPKKTSVCVRLILVLEGSLKRMYHTYYVPDTYVPGIM